MPYTFPGHTPRGLRQPGLTSQQQVSNSIPISQQSSKNLTSEHMSLLGDIFDRKHNRQLSAQTSRSSTSLSRLHAKMSKNFSIKEENCLIVYQKWLRFKGTRQIKFLCVFSLTSKAGSSRTTNPSMLPHQLSVQQFISCTNCPRDCLHSDTKHKSQVTTYTSHQPTTCLGFPQASHHFC